MGKNKHHFVPRFFLKAFESEPKRINVYNLRRRRSIENVSLRDQCYQHHFYGQTEDLENALMEMESKMAPIVKATAERQILPPANSPERVWLAAFVLLQSLRTTAAAERVKTSSDQFVEVVFRPDVDGEQKSEFEKAHAEFQDPVLLSLSSLRQGLPVISDLQMHLIAANGQSRFVTSDNPVFRYNLFCEGTKGTGTLGWGQHGFQAFVPLSPTTLLILYDARVYKVGSRSSSINVATDDDVRELNQMQFINASENVYFNEWGMATQMERLHHQTQRIRDSGGTRVFEYIDDQNELHSLVQSYEQMVNLRLSLSFLSLRRDARRVPFHSRSQGVRRPELMTPIDSGEPLSDGRDHIRFVRPDHHPTLKGRDSERLRPSSKRRGDQAS
jgi:hypothetical protein